MSQPIFLQHHGGCAEGIGFQDVGPGVQVTLVDASYRVRAGDDQVFIAAFELRTSEFIGSQVECLNSGAHCAVDNKDAFA